jgi:hypothetical protein
MNYESTLPELAVVTFPQGKHSGCGLGGGGGGSGVPTSMAAPRPTQPRVQWALDLSFPGV